MTNEKAPLLHPRGSYGALSYSGHGHPGTSKDDVDGESKELRVLFTRRDFILVSIIMVGVVVIVAVTLGLGLPRLHAKREKYFNVAVQPSSSQLHVFGSSALVSDGEPCAAIGKSMLDQGGTAVDAAVAMVLCGGVVNPTSAGLGGGFLMTIYNSSRKAVEVVDAREMAPSGSKEDMFERNAELSVKGGLAIAVPGELRGLGLAHKRYGVLNWTEIVMPSVHLCRNGVPVSHYLASKINLHNEDIIADPGLRDQFTNKETGNLFKEGEILKRPLLGDTLEKVATGGPDIFYQGDMAKTIAQEIQGIGGILTVEDLQNYTAKVRQPVSMPLQEGKEIFYSVPTPGSGSIVAAILNVLSGYNFTQSSVSDIDSTVLTYHRMIETYKFAYAQRSHLGDSDYVNITKILLNLTNPEFGSAIRSRISDDSTHPIDYYGSEFGIKEDHGTSHCQVLASNGDAVTVTSTINTQFGSKFASPSTGIIFNNEMDDFSSPNSTNYFGVAPSKGNYISPGKRPLSSMSPSIVVDKETGKVKYVLGGNGGTRIITALAQVAANLMWFGKDVKEAIDEPRFHHQLYPDYVQHEKSFSQVFKDRLENIGHKTRIDSEISVILGIVRTNAGTIHANVDYRKGGSVDGI